MERYLLARPSLRAAIEWPILIALSILGAIFHFPKVPLPSSIKVSGLMSSHRVQRIRHPGYLGFGIWWGTVPILAVLFVVLTVLTALRERFQDYEEYMKQVRWRFIPWVF